MNEWEWQLLEDKNVLEEVDIQSVRVRRGAGGLRRRVDPIEFQRSKISGTTRD